MRAIRIPFPLCYSPTIKRILIGTFKPYCVPPVMHAIIIINCVQITAVVSIEPEHISIIKIDSRIIWYT